MKFYKFSLFILLITCVYSCTPDERRFTGSYEIDKPVAFTEDINYRETLILKENHEFELSGDSIDTHTEHGK